MADPAREGLRAAGQVIARVMRRVAAVRTREGAAAVNDHFEGSELVVSAGHPGGPWGWEPIQALMFDDNRRHPLYGNKSHWYHEGHYPITEITERQSIDEAVDAFADTAVPLYLDEAGIGE